MVIGWRTAAMVSSLCEHTTSSVAPLVVGQSLWFLLLDPTLYILVTLVCPHWSLLHCSGFFYPQAVTIWPLLFWLSFIVLSPSLSHSLTSSIMWLHVWPGLIFCSCALRKLLMCPMRISWSWAPCCHHQTGWRGLLQSGSHEAMALHKVRMIIAAVNKLI